jgi:hypothetical protein
MQQKISTGVIAAILIALIPQTGNAIHPESGALDDAPSALAHGKPAPDRGPPQGPSRLKDEEIYGHELMSTDEIARYRQELGQQMTAAERARFNHEHEERMRKRAMERSRDLVPPGQGPIYGGKLMSVEERNEYREALRNMRSEAERAQFEARHREEIQKRARALRIDLEEAE